MSYDLFKVLHLLGVFLLFAALGGAVLRAYAARQTPPRDHAAKLVGITHGLALVILWSPASASSACSGSGCRGGCGRSSRCGW